MGQGFPGVAQEPLVENDLRGARFERHAAAEFELSADGCRARGRQQLQAANAFVERFDTEPYSDFSAK